MNIFNQFRDDGMDYLQSKKQLLKMQAVKKGSAAGSALAGILVIIILSVFFLVFIGIGLALLIGNAVGNAWGGFLITGAIFLLLIFIVMVGMKKGVFENIIIRKTMDNKVIDRESLDKEIDALRQSIGMKEQAFKSKASNPFTYIGSFALLRKLYKMFKK